MLELKNINKYYNTGTVNEMCLFQDFNLKVDEGEFVSVVGSNGSGTGKTSPECRNTNVSAASAAYTRIRLWEPAPT